MKYSYVVSQEDQGLRLDNFIIKKLNTLTRSHVKNLIQENCVFLNQQNVKSGEKLKVGQVVDVILLDPKPLDVLPEEIEIDIVYQDNDLAVINKQAGLVVHPANGNESGTLVNALLNKIDNLSGINGVIRPGIVHRLDKDTSGLLIVAKNDYAHVNLSKQIETKVCKRCYLALCHGVVKQDEGVIKTGFGRSLKDRKKMAVFPLGQGKEAETHYKVVKRFSGYTLVEFNLKTGRTHQIRVHAKHLGHPIVCDFTYFKLDKNFSATRQLLHAYKITFNHPTTKEELTFTVDLPEDFKKALNKLEYTIN